MANPVANPVDGAGDTPVDSGSVRYDKSGPRGAVNTIEGLTRRSGTSGRRAG